MPCLYSTTKIGPLLFLSFFASQTHRVKSPILGKPIVTETKAILAVQLDAVRQQTMAKLVNLALLCRISQCLIVVQKPVQH